MRAEDHGVPLLRTSGDNLEQKLNIFRCSRRQKKLIQDKKLARAYFSEGLFGKICGAVLMKRSKEIGRPEKADFVGIAWDRSPFLNVALMESCWNIMIQQPTDESSMLTRGFERKQKLHYGGADAEEQNDRYRQENDGIYDDIHDRGTRRAYCPIAAKYQLVSAYLFGLYARGDATESSDVDILIDRSGLEMQGPFAIGGLYDELCSSVDKEVDLVTLQSLKDAPNQEPLDKAFAQTVMEDMLLIYEGHER